ncbi:type VII secretion system-associated protein [Streptomyces sp. NPDC046862]|uniref:type VII secretion system-associated protein n=1 Tax=Streptomyces sp. NPDC046862 TaxID=3154603 RepID=UPI0034529F9B
MDQTEQTDPNSDTTKLALDKAGLESFRDDRVRPFREEIGKMLVDDPNFGPAVGTLIGKEDIKFEDFDSYLAGKPLALGWMMRNDEVDGQVGKLNTGLAKMFDELQTIFGEQITLFEDIESNLDATLKSLFATQNTNLTSIDGQKFLDIFEDVDEDMGGGQGAGEGDD